MAFEIRVLKHDDVNKTSLPYGVMSDALPYDSNGISIESYFEYEEAGIKYLYKPMSMLIITGKDIYDFFEYYQLLTPAENNQHPVPPIYLKGYLIGKSAIPAKGIDRNGTKTQDFFLPLMPRRTTDSICINGKCYTCTKIIVSKQETTLILDVLNISKEDYLLRNKM